MDRPRPAGLAGAAGRLAADPLRDEAAARNAGLPLLPAATAPAGLRRSAMGRSPAPASSPRLSAEKGRQKKGCDRAGNRSEEHTSELQSLMRIEYAVVCLKNKKT